MHCLTIPHYQLAPYRRPQQWWRTDLAIAQHNQRMREVESWAHTGIMMKEEAVKEEVGEVVEEGERGEDVMVERGGKETVEEGERKKAGGVMVKREEVWEDILVTSSEDSEDDPIVKEEVGVAPRLLLNPYFVE